MFSMCSKPTLDTSVSKMHEFGGKQIKGGYLLRYKRQLLWNRWTEEWVVLYDNSTMAWFSESSHSLPSGMVLVNDAPEMLAIAQWTGQIPDRPPLPNGCSVTQLIALSSNRKKSKVYWMIAQSEQEASEWVAAISKTLPPPPLIELIIDKPRLTGSLRRPLVRIRPATKSEVNSKKFGLVQSSKVRGDTAIAILSKNTNAGADYNGTLACILPWGHGWGWATLPNGIWSGGLTWSQCEENFTLHALPATHCSNVTQSSDAGVYNSTSGANISSASAGTTSSAADGADNGGFDLSHGTGIEEVTGDDFDYAMDFGDFFF